MGGGGGGDAYEADDLDTPVYESFDTGAVLQLGGGGGGNSLDLGSALRDDLNDGVGLDLPGDDHDLAL